MAPEKPVVLQGPGEGFNQPPVQTSLPTPTNLGTCQPHMQDSTCGVCARGVPEQTCVRVCCLRQPQGAPWPDGGGPVPTLAPQAGTTPVHGTVEDLSVLLGDK